MDKNQILESAKQDMKQIIEELTLPRIPEASGKIISYMYFLERLEELPHIETPERVELSKEEREVVAAQIIEELDEPEVEVEPVKIAHRFTREIKGGLLRDIGAYVPEKIVRELELQEGDLVFAEKIDTDVPYDGPTRYEFEVAEYRDEPQPKDRVQINYAIVEYQALLGRFVCEKTISGEYIRLGEIMHTVLLSDKEVIDFQIKDGDIVDLAYKTSNINNFRVIWRYSVEQRGEFNNVKPAPVMTKKKDKVKKEYPQTLAGKSILMVGFQPGEPAMKEEVERRGGELIWSSGREGHDRMFTLVNKSDCVINMLEHVSHRGTINAVEIAKTLDKPHGRLHTFGRTSFVQKIYELLEIDSDE